MAFYIFSPGDLAESAKFNENLNTNDGPTTPKVKGWAMNLE